VNDEWIGVVGFVEQCRSASLLVEEDVHIVLYSVQILEHERHRVELDRRLVLRWRS